jgi:large subunit ribosomal protein L18e
MLSKRKIEKKAERKENPELQKAIAVLKKQKKPLWIRAADLLSRPSKKAVSVNLQKLNKLTKANDFVIVPGKVLGKGELEHKITLGAFKFSESAREKLGKKEALTIPELVEKAKGTVKIIT